MPKSIINEGNNRMGKAIEALQKELALIRTGRANPSVLNSIHVSYYGTPTPLNQIAAISVPEAQVLMIKPYDKSVLDDIVKEIQKADLNLVPQSDGTVVRINFPALTEDRRKTLVKDVKGIGEKSKVGIRNIRRDLMDQLKKNEKDGYISEDELKKYNDEVQKATDKFIEKVEEVLTEKEKSILEIWLKKSMI